jgi:endonuclease/exonuclease/phosphatase family metal-dependent hydrolase
LDFIGLNEVHGAFLWSGNDQAAIIGRKLGMAWLYAPTEQCWSGTHFGSAILTNLPIREWNRIPLEFHDGNGFRNIVQSRIPYSAGVVEILVTHLDRRTDRHAQLSAVFKRFVEIEGPAILMGDLNTTIEDPQIRTLLATPGVIDCVGSHVASDPPKRIDWIFARGLRCIDAGLTEVGPSDHPHAWAELELPAGTALEAAPLVR